MNGSSVKTFTQSKSKRSQAYEQSENVYVCVCVKVLNSQQLAVFSRFQAHKQQVEPFKLQGRQRKFQHTHTYTHTHALKHYLCTLNKCPVSSGNEWSYGAKHLRNNKLQDIAAKDVVKREREWVCVRKSTQMLIDSRKSSKSYGSECIVSRK